MNGLDDDIHKNIRSYLYLWLILLACCFRDAAICEIFF